MAKKIQSTLAKNAGLIFIACLFIGMGIGGLFDEMGAGVLLGLGAGFLAMFYVKSQ